MRSLCLLAAVAVTVVAFEAEAGGCVGCTTAAECSGGFCVLWSTNPGCGIMNRTCCPGQTPNTGSCVVMDGRPRCEDAGTCTVVSAPGTGGGSGATAGGSGGTAGGSGATAGGSGGTAGGTGATAGGSSTGTGGSGTAGSGSAGSGGEGGGGCSCSASGALGGVVLLALARMLRRRRQAGVTVCQGDTATSNFAKL